MECGRGQMGKAVGIYSLSCRSLFCRFGESDSNKCTMVLEAREVVRMELPAEDMSDSLQRY